jgi:hypothetical protein
MGAPDLIKERRITPEMTVLDVVARYPGTESVFKNFDEQAGVCICCQSLFETLRDVSKKYDIDLDQLMTELETRMNGIQERI